MHALAAHHKQIMADAQTARAAYSKRYVKGLIFEEV